MKLFFAFLYITLVFSHVAHSATEDRSIISVESQTPTQFPNQDKMEDLSISEVPNVKPVKLDKPFIFSQQKALFLYGGSNYSTDSREYQEHFGFYYNKYLENLNAYELGFQITDDLGRIQLGKKYLTNIGRLRYHIGWQLGITVDANKGLANLVNFKKFFLGGLAGLEYTFRSPNSIRFDFALFQGSDETTPQLNIGYVHSW